MAKDNPSGQGAGDRVKMVKGDTTDEKVAEPSGQIIERERLVPEHELPKPPHAGMQVVEEDIFEKFYPDGVKQPMYRKLFSKGQIVPKSHYEATLEGAAIVRDEERAGRVGKSEDKTEAPA